MCFDFGVERGSAVVIESCAEHEHSHAQVRKSTVAVTKKDRSRAGSPAVAVPMLLSVYRLWLRGFVLRLRLKRGNVWVSYHPAV